MRILLDIDGCCVDFCRAYLDLLHETTGRRHHQADVTTFDFSRCIATADEDRAVWQLIDERPGLVRDLKWIYGAREGLAELRLLGQVVAVTSPSLGPYWMHERAHWLLAAGFTKREIIFATDKALVGGDVLIDDFGENVNSWQRAHPTGFSVIFDAAYNQAGDTLGYRARGWGDVVRYVHNIKPMCQEAS